MINRWALLAVVIFCIAAKPFVTQGDPSQLDAKAKTVEVSLAGPDAGCKRVGPVIGKWTRVLAAAGFDAQSQLLAQTHDLVDLALRDVREQAANAGGNLVHVSAPQLITMQGYTTGAVILGVAYKCGN